MKTSLIYLNKVQNVSSFFLKKDGIYYFNNESFLLKLDINFNEDWKLKLDTQFFLMGEDESFLVSFTNYNKLVLISNSEIKKVKTIRFKPIYLDNENLISGSLFDGEFFYFLIYDINKDKELVRFSTEDAVPIKTFNNFTICQKAENSLILYSMLTRERIWELKFDKLLDIESIKLSGHPAGQILLLNRDLVVTLIGIENFACTFIFDITTGEVLKKLEDFHGALMKMDPGHVVVTNGFSEQNQVLKILDTDTYNVSTYPLATILPQGWCIDHNKSVVHNNKLYFAAKEGIRNIVSILGVLDLDNIQLIDHYELLKDTNKKADNHNRYQVQEIKVNDHMVGINTAGGTLHVFEHESYV